MPSSNIDSELKFPEILLQRFLMRRLSILVEPLQAIACRGFFVSDPRWSELGSVGKFHFFDLVFEVPSGFCFADPHRGRPSTAINPCKLSLAWFFSSRRSLEQAPLGREQKTLDHSIQGFSCLAVRGGFEPPVRFPARMFSKHVVSATHPPHRFTSLICGLQI